MTKADRRHGALRDRFHFQKRSDADDGFGTVLPGAGPFVTQFTLNIALDARRGTETVIASRLQGVQPYFVTARWSVQLLGITNAWQLVSARENDTRVLNVVSIPADPDGQRKWLEFVATMGPPS